MINNQDICDVILSEMTSLGQPVTSTTPIPLVFALYIAAVTNSRFDTNFTIPKTVSTNAQRSSGAPSGV